MSNLRCNIHKLYVHEEVRWIFMRKSGSNLILYDLVTLFIETHRSFSSLFVTFLYDTRNGSFKLKSSCFDNDINRICCLFSTFES